MEEDDYVKSLTDEGLIEQFIATVKCWHYCPCECTCHRPFEMQVDPYALETEVSRRIKTQKTA